MDTILVISLIFINYVIIISIYSYHSIIRLYIETIKLGSGETIDDAMPLYSSLEGRYDELLSENIQICTQFIMDLITHILMSYHEIIGCIQILDKCRQLC